MDPPTFLPKKHIAYFQRCLTLLPHPYQSEESVRLSLAFFCLGGLDVLGALDATLTDDQRQGHIDWVYAQQVTPAITTVPGTHGFRGGPFDGPLDDRVNGVNYVTANLATTYSALLSLVILGDDLARVDRKAIVRSMTYLQQPNGGIVPHPYSAECDIRFLYCACVICHLLDDWSGFDSDRAVEFIRRCQNYDGGIATSPGEESHGGMMLCATASLKLMGRLADGLPDRVAVLRWCIDRQNQGFHGRINKTDDTCYSFWVGAALKVLGHYDLIDDNRQREFLLTTQRHIGGFGKAPTEYPDVLHSYMGLVAFSMMGESGLAEIIPELNISKESYQKFLVKRCV
ncbi:protein geranylgeranyltransferas-like protein type I beta subunit [Dimargaris cristalligena]|uniref:Geranylgeranyl transferase type-1 subunit beta n=1 Tax=Dimargaris cristalligena TaxID=215637 RepID=A0A4P9ZUP9_9FUNG|nr:protein geranylgeranyltransferas-like protein type I beta subunit [Dimargaris cristalligena]|eukprot:RKP36320.1 protein geranylgeranyltransferas-like protein type I beta subunit [Dimargaris cristalligena]